MSSIARVWRGGGRARTLMEMPRPLNIVRRFVMMTVAAIWRRMLWRTSVIAVTGSVGKTTAKNCIAAALATRFPVAKTPGNDNHFRGVPKTLLRIRPWHRYAVVEVGVDRPGQMRWFARVVKPDMVVFLGAAHTHTDRFASLEEIAEEKGQLVQALPSSGTAILYAGNPYSSACVPPSGVRVIRFGDEGTLRARNPRSVWPDRLSFDLMDGDSATRVQTEFVGEHWVPSVLAGFAAAQACGVPLLAAASAIARVQPMASRLSPMPIPNGAIMLRDDRHGSVDAFAAALRVMEQAVAERLVLVAGEMSDDKRKPRRRANALGRMAAGRFGLIVFVGDNSERARRAAIDAGMRPECVHAFTATQAAAMFLRGELRRGDLVLVKGRASAHIDRIYHAMVGEVACWRERCGKHRSCDVCWELHARPRTNERPLRP